MSYAVSVLSRSSGFYRLGFMIDGEFCPAYAGRSDSELQRRLTRQSKIKEYSYFSLLVTRTVRRAFHLECREYHLQGERLSNEIHPAKPSGLDYSCPYWSLKNSPEQLVSEHQKPTNHN